MHLPCASHARCGLFCDFCMRRILEVALHWGQERDFSWAKHLWHTSGHTGTTSWGGAPCKWGKARFTVEALWHRSPPFLCCRAHLFLPALFIFRPHYALPISLPGSGGAHPQFIGSRSALQIFCALLLAQGHPAHVEFYAAGCGMHNHCTSQQGGKSTLVMVDRYPGCTAGAPAG